MVEARLHALVRGDNRASFLDDLSNSFGALRAARRLELLGFLRQFLHHCEQRHETPALDDCSLGNLLFTGAYLAVGNNFNRAVQALATLCEARGRLLNINRGESLFLAAMKADGEVLYREAEIVGPQGPSPVVDLFLLRQELTSDRKKELETKATIEKRQTLKSWEAEAELSEEADQALREADLIIYGPGTQYSSLYPSYRTLGLGAAIQASKARTRAFIANLDYDHEIQGLSVADLVDRALELLGDIHNRDRLITHLLCDRQDLGDSRALRWRGPQVYKNIQVIQGDFRAADAPALHCGLSVARTLFELRSNHSLAAVGA